MELKITHVDSFTDKPFSGNPAAVCITEVALDQIPMQQIAAEVNLSETAFLYPKDNGYHLRWFTPKAEVSLCGHATLASAHVLWEQERDKNEIIHFYTLSGKLTAQKNNGSIELDFPVEHLEPANFPDGMIEAIGATPIFTGKTAIRYFAELNSADEVRQLKPDVSKLNNFSPGRLIVTSRSDDTRYDFISRYFAPGIGIPEDPVTGSAHCSLALYWAKKLKKTKFTAYQASARGGEIEVILENDRVKLIGKAVTIMQGKMVVPTGAR